MSSLRTVRACCVRVRMCAHVFARTLLARVCLRACCVRMRMCLRALFERCSPTLSCSLPRYFTLRLAELHFGHINGNLWTTHVIGGLDECTPPARPCSALLCSAYARVRVPARVYVASCTVRSEDGLSAAGQYAICIEKSNQARDKFKAARQHARKALTDACRKFEAEHMVPPCLPAASAAQPLSTVQ